VITAFAAYLVFVVLLRALFTRQLDRKGAAVVVVALVIAALAAPSGMILQKVVGRLLLPFGLAWAGSIGVLAWCHARRSTQTLPAALVVVVITLLGNEPLGQWLLLTLEAPFQNDPFKEAPVDAVIVLGGGAADAPHGQFELSPSGDRVMLGARLWHAQRTPLLIATGTPIPGFLHQFDNLRATEVLWQGVGVPKSAIVLVDNTRTTNEEAIACAHLIRERGFRRVGLVTSAWHMRRALRLFAQHDLGGGVLVPLAADHRGTPSWEGLFSLVPVGQGAWSQQKAIWEYVGAAVGR
jgi:uncharacterized SAM-binding protein YcdF (DUF218 family)